MIAACRGPLKARAAGIKAEGAFVVARRDRAGRVESTERKLKA